MEIEEEKGKPDNRAKIQRGRSLLFSRGRVEKEVEGLLFGFQPKGYASLPE
jgi:hypothetical protein